MFIIGGSGQKGECTLTILASINKSTHVGQPVFSVLFALLSLAGDSPPASKRTKIPRKFKAVRCEAVLPEQKCSQTRKRPQRILCVFSRALTQYEGISARQNRVCPCQSTLFCRQLICTQVQQTYTSEQHNKQTAANQRNDIRLHHINSLSVCSTKPAARAFVRRVAFLIAYSSESVQSCPVSVRAMSAVSFSKSVSPSPRRASASSASMRGRLFGWQRRRSFS